MRLEDRELRSLEVYPPSAAPEATRVGGKKAQRKQGIGEKGKIRKVSRLAGRIQVYLDNFGKMIKNKIFKNPVPHSADGSFIKSLYDFIGSCYADI